MCVPIILNKAVGLRNENATFLHNFALLYLRIIRKWLTICVFAGLTRKLILALSNQPVASLPVWQAGMPGQARQDTRVKNTPYCSTVTAQRK